MSNRNAMLKLFKRNKPNIEAIAIPTDGWELVKDDAAMRQWINQEQTIALSVNFFDKAPDLPSIQSIDRLRNFYRGQIIEAKGGLIQVDIVEIEGIKVIKTIFKIQQQEPGVTYLSSLTIPFGSCSYVIKIQAPDIQNMGKREALIADRLLKKDVIQVGDNGYTGWIQDPYAGVFNEGNPMNLSEKEEYDQEFQDHPLSISRKLMTKIENEIQIDEVLKAIKQFKR